MRIEQAEKLIANFYDSKTQNILRKTKLLIGTDIFINEDYCEDTEGNETFT